MSDNLININSSSQLNELILNNKYLVLDFYSPNCIPCKRIKPFIEKMAENNKKDIVFALIDVYEDDNIDIKDEYEIKKFPSLVFIKDKNIVDTYIGHDLEIIEKLVNKHKCIEMDDDF